MLKILKHNVVRVFIGMQIHGPAKPFDELNKETIEIGKLINYVIF
ncbi:MAG: hypothetical protein ABI295_01015 [Xanthomarina sp.]